MKKLDNSDIGCEGCIEFSYKCNDGVSFKIENIGFAKAPSEDVKKSCFKWRGCSAGGT